MRTTGYRVFAAALLACSAVSGQAPPSRGALPALRGTWTATAGPSRIFRGTWTAHVPPETPNIAAGSWMLLDDAGEVSLQGTWSAQKGRAGWRGVWSAEVLGNRSLHGTWAAATAGWKGRTLREMLEAAAANQISGSWQSGPYAGSWWLKGSQNSAP